MSPKHEKPKKRTVTMYQAVRAGFEPGELMISQKLFASEQDALNKLGTVFIKLLTDRPVEIEVEE